MKIVEEAGQKLAELITSPNPFKAPCNREKCNICTQDEKSQGVCFTRGVVYKSSCTLCKTMGREVVYVGESSRTLLERNLEHESDARQGLQESHRVEHVTRDHLDQEEMIKNPNTAFTIKVHQQHPKPLSRLVHEALVIRRCKGTLLNRKEEYCRNQLPSLQLLQTTHSQEKEKDKEKTEHEKEKENMEDEEVMKIAREKKRKTETTTTTSNNKTTTEPKKKPRLEPTHPKQTSPPPTKRSEAVTQPSNPTDPPSPPPQGDNITAREVTAEIPSQALQKPPINPLLIIKDNTTLKPRHNRINRVKKTKLNDDPRIQSLRRFFHPKFKDQPETTEQ